MSEKLYDVIVIGGGAAGLTSAIYTCRKKLKTLLVTVDIGGQTNLTNHIENYPGYTELSGPKLMQTFLSQAEKFGTEVVYGKTTKIDKKGKNFHIKLSNDEEYEGKTIILAYGKVPRELGIPGEKKFIGRGVSTCATCLPPEETVIANSSAKKIINMQTEDRVLTTDGTFQKVLNKMEREYEGEMVEIKTRFFTEPVLLTTNHPVFKMNIRKGTGPNYWKFEFTEPEWTEAGSLKKDDVLLYPIIKEIKDIEFIRISDTLENIEVDENDFTKNKHETHSARRVPNRIKINSNFMRLVGYYLSEGSITSRGVNIYFNKNETNYIEDVKMLFEKIFGIKPTIRIEDNVCRIMIFSKIIRDLFNKLFGKYAHNKRLPHWAILLPKEKQAEAIKGIYRGDGCKRDKDFCIVTNSRNLAYQLRDILLRLDIIPSIQKRDLDKLKPSYIEGREINFRHDKYHVIIGGPSLQKMSEVLGVYHEKINNRKFSSRHAFFKNGHVLLPIRNTIKRHYKGKVHNIAVDNNNTYVAKNFIVHNCDAPIFKNKIVAIVGGGNSALEAAILSSEFSTKVYLVHRRDQFRGDPITVDKLKTKKNVEIIYNHIPVAVEGEKFVSGFTIEDVNTKKQRTLEVKGVFVEIGYIIDTTIIEHLVKINKTNEIIVNTLCETSTPGMFAAGDLTDVPYKQTVISAGEGAKAGMSAYNYLQELEGKPKTKVDWK